MFRRVQPSGIKGDGVLGWGCVGGITGKRKKIEMTGRALTHVRAREGEGIQKDRGKRGFGKKGDSA